MASHTNADRPGKTEFSIDDFFGEIEKAEDERLNKRLPQERLRNKRALDQAARRAAEASQGVEPIVPAKAETSRRVGAKGKRSEATGQPVRREDKRPSRSEATGMQLKKRRL